MGAGVIHQFFDHQRYVLARTIVLRRVQLVDHVDDASVLTVDHRDSGVQVITPTEISHGRAPVIPLDGASLELAERLPVDLDQCIPRRAPRYESRFTFKTPSTAPAAVGKCPARHLRNDQHARQTSAETARLPRERPAALPQPPSRPL